MRSLKGISCTYRLTKRYPYLTYVFAAGLVFIKILNIVESESISVIPSASKLDLSYEEEYRAFEDELIISVPKASSRTKRFIYLNSDTNSAVALLLGIPLTIILPSLSNIFNKWRRRRSIRDVESIENYNYEEDPETQSNLDRISTYFELIDIPEHNCQLRAICEFSAEPDKYYPLSDMIISRIRNPSLPAMVYFENEESKGRKENISENGNGDKTNSLFRIYNEAANEGSHFGNSKCQKEFNGCHYSMDKLLNMPTLRFWTSMQKLLRINFKDGDSVF